MMRTCDTCAKRINQNKCAVLTEMIGQSGGCWSWTDDKNWEEKIRRAVSEYTGNVSWIGKGNARQTSVDPERVRELHERGLSTYQIARVLGVSRSGVMYRLKKPDKERNNLEAEIRKVVELRTAGLTQKQIAEKLGISRSAVMWRLERAKREGYAC